MELSYIELRVILVWYGLYDIIINHCMKRWVIIFRALANINRLTIIKLLSDGGRMNVGDLADALHISFKATSNHLAILKNLDVLDATGVAGHVLYSLHPALPQDLRRALSLCIKLKQGSK